MGKTKKIKLIIKNWLLFVFDKQFRIQYEVGRYWGTSSNGAFVDAWLDRDERKGLSKQERKEIKVEMYAEYKLFKGVSND